MTGQPTRESTPLRNRDLIHKAELRETANKTLIKVIFPRGGTGTFGEGRLTSHKLKQANRHIKMAISMVLNILYRDIYVMIYDMESGQNV